MSTENVSLMLNCGLVSVIRCEPDGSLILVCGVCMPVSLPSTVMLVHGLEPRRKKPSGPPAAGLEAGAGAAATGLGGGGSGAALAFGAGAAGLALVGGGMLLSSSS